VTRGEAEFLAAALQDNRRAVLVGECTSGDAYESSVISCGDDIGAVALHTAVLHRGDGRSLLRHDVDRSPHSETIADTRAPVTAPVEKPTVTWGVEPDHHVPMDDNQLMEMFKAQREREIFDANAAKGEDGFADRQIQKAIELLESALEAEAG
jgi:C-terminal processing protease CtpA/Prc